MEWDWKISFVLKYSKRSSISSPDILSNVVQRSLLQKIKCKSYNIQTKTQNHFTLFKSSFQSFWWTLIDAFFHIFKIKHATDTTMLRQDSYLQKGAKQWTDGGECNAYFLFIFIGSKRRNKIRIEKTRMSYLFFSHKHNSTYIREKLRLWWIHYFVRLDISYVMFLMQILNKSNNFLQEKVE